jgi:multidrug efflux pump subunit AcrA (membrane-fusion protein)/YHS domain-containing protein
MQPDWTGYGQDGTVPRVTSTSRPGVAMSSMETGPDQTDDTDDEVRDTASTPSARRRGIRNLAALTAVLVVVIGWAAWQGSRVAPGPGGGSEGPHPTAAVWYRCTMPECGDPGSADPNSRCPVCGMKREPVSARPEPTTWYRCPMPECNDPGSSDPNSHCPVCGMKREPVEPSGSGLDIALSEKAVRQAEIATEPLRVGSVYRRLRTFGQVEVDETRRVIVSARVEGTVERLTADETGMAVGKGDHLLEIFSIDLLNAQNELLRLIWGFGRIPGRGRNRSVDQDLVTARYKLELYGMTPEQIDTLIEGDHEDPYLIVSAPIDGTIIRKDVTAGQYLRVGDPLYELADLSRLWLQLSCYEDDLPWIHVGQEVVAEARALPGEELRGRVSFISPELDVTTRTVRVRVEIANPRGRLSPGMYMTAWTRTRLDGDEHLLVPRQAVLAAGERTLVYVETGQGSYRGIDVRLGPLAEDETGEPCYPVIDGLDGDEHVVTRGAFAVDSQAQIVGLPSLFAPGPTPSKQSPEPRTVTSASPEPASATRPSSRELSARSQPDSPEQELCPVVGEPIDRTAFVDYRGVRIYFHSHICTPKFLADPERYIPNLPQSMQDRIAAWSSHREANRND